MKKTPPPLIAQSSFPSFEATDNEKSSDAFGLNVAHAIQHEWFGRSGLNCKYYDRQSEFHKLRLYARGEQPIDIYKTGMSINGDTSQLNLNWQPPAVVPKFVDIIVNGMSDRLFTPKAFAEDPTSAKKRNTYQESIEKDMLAKQILDQTRDQFGVDVYNNDPKSLPSNDQELQLHMQLDYKPGIEIAAEIAISTVFEMNNFEEVRAQFDYDVTTIGVGIAKHWYSYGEGIKIESVDPAETVHSYTEKRDGSDIFYWGEVKKIHLTELKKINPNLTLEDIKEIKSIGSRWNHEFNQSSGNSVLDSETVNVLFFNYKTEKKFIYKKKNLENGGSRAIRRDESFQPEEASDLFEKLSKTIDVWYDGALILGTNKLLKWGLMENMIRPDAQFQKAVPNYIMRAPRMYKGKIDSTVKRMVKYADLIALTDLKIQQIQQKMVPDGVFLDLDGVNAVDLGNGGTYGAQGALDMYFATGSVVGRSYTQEGEFNNARSPITELNNSSGQSKLITLTKQYDHWLNMIRDVIGINEAADASTPDSNALLGVQKLAALNSNTATKHIRISGLQMTKDIATATCLRVSDVLEYADDKEEFANQIGKFNVSILEDIKNLPLHSFGIFIEVSPDAEEKQLIESNIQAALAKNAINLEDAIDIRNCKNIKQGNELLKLKRRRKEEKDYENEMKKIEAQSQANIKSAQASAEAKMAADQALIKGKLDLAEAETNGAIRKLTFEVEAKKVLMEKEFNYNMELKGIEVASVSEKEKEKEDRKDKRLDKQSSQQSELIKQRKDNSPPVNFESNEDTLDGIGLESFG